MYDLLDPAAANLQLRENIKKGVFVEGLMEQVVTTPNEAYQVLKRCHSFSELTHLLALKPASLNAQILQILAFLRTYRSMGAVISY